MPKEVLEAMPLWAFEEEAGVIENRGTWLIGHPEYPVHYYNTTTKKFEELKPLS